MANDDSRISGISGLEEEQPEEIEITFGQQETQEGGWTDIKFISYGFSQHCNDKEVHRSLRDSIGEQLEGEEIDALFKTSERLELKNDALNILRDEINGKIAGRATLATTDLGRIPVIMKDLPMVRDRIYVDRGTTVSNPIRITNLSRLLQALEETRRERKDTLMIKFIINTLHFHKGDDFCPANFEHIGNDAHPVKSRGKSKSSAETEDADNGSAQDMAKAMLKMMETMMKQREDDDRARKRSTDYPVTPRGIGVENFNINSLPSDVRDRVKLHDDQGRMTTKLDMKPFMTNIPNLTYDPTGNTTMRGMLHHHIHPDKVVMRDGTVFRLNTTTPIHKKFVEKPPRLPGKKMTPQNIRRWYKKFLQHCQNHGVFLCPYYCFRKNVESTSGFSCGEDTDGKQHELPYKYRYELPRWSGLIGQAIREIFPEGTRERNICESYETDGYYALKEIIFPEHPTFAEYGEAMAMQHPIQAKSMDIHEYLNEYNDYLEMRAFTENVSTNLTDYNQMTKFIASCKWGGYYLLNTETVRNERKSSEPTVKYKYSPVRIAMTIHELLGFIDTDRIPPFENMTKVRKISSPSGSPAKLGQGYTNSQRNSRNRNDTRRDKRTRNEALVTKKVNMVGVQQDLDIIERQLHDLENKTNDNETLVAKAIYRVGINSVKTNGSFDTSQNCLVCSGQGHAFDGCPVLNDHELLKDIHIAFCACCKRIGRKVEQATKPVFAVGAWGVEEDSDDEYYTLYTSEYEPSDFL